MQFFLILIFISMYLSAQDFDSGLKLVYENIGFGRIEIAELKVKTILDKDPSYASSYVSLSTISIMKTDKNNASKNANLEVRIDEDFRPCWEGLNSLRKKIQIGPSSVENNNYKGALLIYSELFGQYSNYTEVPYYLDMNDNNKKNYKQASKYFQNALDLYPDHYKAKKALINAEKRI